MTSSGKGKLLVGATVTDAENVLLVVEQIRAGARFVPHRSGTERGGIKTARGSKWYATTVQNTLMAENET